MYPMTPFGAHGHMPHATCRAMLGPIRASQWAMGTTYELLWCIVIDVMTRETLARRPQQLESFKIHTLREPTDGATCVMSQHGSFHRNEPPAVPTST
jgi:hypothetical protein